MSTYEAVKARLKARVQNTETAEPITTGQHKHTLRRAYKRTRNANGARFILSWICTTCPYRQAYELTDDEPITNKETT